MLTVADLEMFARLGIPRELVEAAQIRRVTDAEARELLSLPKFSGDLSGIEFPYFAPSTNSGTPRRLTSRVRRDHPEIEDSQPKNKYMSAYGDRRHFYFPPGAGELLDDAGVPVILVEAEKSALALTAWCQRISKRMLPVATGGCWAWRGRTGKVANEKGWMVNEVGPIPDLDCANEREVIVLLDANANSNENVQAARAALVRELRRDRRHCRVRIADLPQIEGINGPDDFVGAQGDAATAELLDGAQGVKEGKQEPKVPQAAEIVNSADDDNIDFFHTRVRIAYATVTIAGHRETIAIRSRQFRNYLAHLHFQRRQKIPGAQAVKDAMTVLEGRALFDGPEREVYVRVASANGNIYLDLGDDKWRAVEISVNGWQVISDPPVRFRRPDGMYALPLPAQDGSLDELLPFLNLTNEEDSILVRAWQVAAIRPTGPYTIFYFTGEQGTAKSTATKIMRRLIDPYKGELRSAPHDERDLVIAASNSHVIAFDNFSRLDPWLSDAMCRLATGGGLATRQLYTDDDEIIFEAQRPQLVNGIEELAVRGDFAERSITVQLTTISDKQRRDEKEFWEEFNCAHPRILTGLLNATSFALSQLPDVKLERKPRMADFAMWSVATEPLLWRPGQFLEAYSRNRGEAHQVVLEDSLIVPHLLLIADGDGWFGRTEDLLNELNRRSRETKGKDGKDSAEQRDKRWPKSSRMLSAQLRRLAPALRTVGIEYKAPDRRTKARNLILQRAAGRQAPPEPKANTNKTSDFAGAYDSADVPEGAYNNGTGADAERVDGADRDQDRHHVSDREQTGFPYGAEGADVPASSDNDLICPGCGRRGDWSTGVGLSKHMATCPQITGGDE